jgi:hypothetical protein
MYNKLFTKILDSSIWLEDAETRLIWITMLAAMDEDGFAEFASAGNVAHRARLGKEETLRAIAILESPDPDSSDPDNDGRRIERVNGGWMVLNAPKYRSITKREDAKAKNRIRVQRFRDKKSGKAPDVMPDVMVGNETSRSVTPSEAVTEAKAETKDTKPKVLVVEVLPEWLAGMEGSKEAWQAFLVHRKGRKAAVTERVAKTIWKRLEDHRDQAVELIEYVIERNWLTFEESWLIGTRFDPRGATAAKTSFREQDRQREEALHQTTSRHGI